MRVLIALSIGLALLAVSGVSEAKSTFPDHVPNALNLDERECLVCHTAVTGRIETLQGFGLAVQATLAANGDNPDWAQLFAADSDLDGYTNGFELGDPDGMWTFGSPDPTAAWAPTNPGDSQSSPCGNGTIEGPEECDGDDLQGATCQSLGQPMSLSPPVCNSRCNINPNPCTEVPMPDPDPVADTAEDTGTTDTSDTDVSMDSSTSNDDDEGCGCEVRRKQSGASPLWLVSGLALLLLVRRRL